MPNTVRTQEGERRRKTNNLRRLNLCFSNPMQPFANESPPSSPTATSSSLLQHHHIDHNRNRPSSPTSSIMINNFNILYDHTEPQPADLATAFASQRFFFSSPGRSNSIVESTTDCTSSSSSSFMAAAPQPPLEEPSTAMKERLLFNGSVAVPTYSPDPYADFRRSMEEMVEARPELMDVKSNWHVLHELLLCYLALNPKGTHKFILGAFADLLVSLISFSSSSSLPPENPNPGDIAGGGEGC